MADLTLPAAVTQVDLATVNRVLNQLKPLTYKQGLKLVQYPLFAISTAQRVQKSENLPNAGSLEKVKGHLLWHEERLKAWKGDENKPYPHADDFKKWTAEAFEEWNATLEGAKYKDAKLSFWKEYAGTLVGLAEEAGRALGQAASTVVEAAARGAGAGVSALFGDVSPLTVIIIAGVAIGGVWHLNNRQRRRGGAHGT